MRRRLSLISSPTLWIADLIGVGIKIYYSPPVGNQLFKFTSKFTTLRTQGTGAVGAHSESKAPCIDQSRFLYHDYCDSLSTITVIPYQTKIAACSECPHRISRQPEMLLQLNSIEVVISDALPPLSSLPPLGMPLPSSLPPPGVL